MTREQLIEMLVAISRIDGYLMSVKPCPGDEVFENVDLISKKITEDLANEQNRR